MPLDEMEYSLPNSEDYRKRRDLSIAQGCLTNSKHPKGYTSSHPTTIVRSDGCYAWDISGKRYVDFICSLGTNLLGHKHPKIDAAVIEQMKLGVSHSLGTDLEVKFAERIKEVFPYMEKIKILKSGSEGCSAAVRIARAFTGRELVFSSDYHGWHDEFTSLTPPAHGVVKDSFKSILPLSQAEAKQTQFAAAIIIEPIVTDISPTRLENLRRIRKFCDDNGTLLIFDETITGLRFPKLSVANWCGVTPDLTIMGKALGAGYPISIVGGRTNVMDCDYFVSSTFAGETISLRAALEVLNILHSTTSIDSVWNEGERFIDSFNKLAPELVRIEGYPTRGVFKGKDEMTMAIFVQECAKAGVLFHPSTWFWCAKHSDESNAVLKICDGVLSLMKTSNVALEGDLPRKPMAQKVRENANA